MMKNINRLYQDISNMLNEFESRSADELVFICGLATAIKCLRECRVEIDEGRAILLECMIRAQVRQWKEIEKLLKNLGNNDEHH